MSLISVESCGLTEPLFISATLKPAPKKQLLIKDTLDNQYISSKTRTTLY